MEKSPPKNPSKTIQFSEIHIWARTHSKLGWDLGSLLFPSLKALRNSITFLALAIINVNWKNIKMEICLTWVCLCYALAQQEEVGFWFVVFGASSSEFWSGDELLKKNYRERAWKEAIVINDDTLWVEGKEGSAVMVKLWQRSCRLFW